MACHSSPSSRHGRSNAQGKETKASSQGQRGAQTEAKLLLTGCINCRTHHVRPGPTGGAASSTPSLEPCPPRLHAAVVTPARPCLTVRPHVKVARGLNTASCAPLHTPSSAPPHPLQVVVRVWDCLICEGSKVLHRTALALLHLYETTVLASSNPDSVKRVLDSRVGYTTCSEQLLQQAFRGIGSLPGSMVGGRAGAREGGAQYTRGGGGGRQGGMC